MNESGKRPTFNRVLVLVDDQGETKTDAGIILKAKEQTKTEWGIIVDMGIQAEVDSDGEISLGDHVEFTRFSGKYDIGKDGKAYRILDMLDIIAVEMNA